MNWDSDREDFITELADILGCGYWWAADIYDRWMTDNAHAGDVLQERPA